MKIFRTLPQNATFRRWISPLIISLTLLFSVLIIATTPPATGYEISIYDAYPVILWVLLSINIFFSIYTIIRSGDSLSKNTYYSYFSILLIETIILSLPIMRGYYSISGKGWDIYHHMFRASQILNSGNLSSTDIYPIMHIWLSILHNFFPDFIVLTIVLSIVFFILYILSLYILGKTILGTKTGGLFVSIFGIPLIFSYGHYAFYPFLFALFIIPLSLYSYQKIIQNPSQKTAFYICAISLSFFIVFCHPMITFFLIIMFSVFVFYELLKRWKISSRLSNIVAINILAIVLLSFLIWLIQFKDLLETLQGMASALIGAGTHISIISYQMNTITTSKASIWLVIDYFIKVYGSIFLYFSLSLFFLLYIIYQYYQNKKIFEVELIYSLQFFVALFIGIALITGYFVIFEPIRAAMYALIFATIMCGLFFYRIWFSEISEKRKLVIITSITVIITFSCMLSILAIYPSPWFSNPNSELTYGDKTGMDWILEYRNEKIPIASEDPDRIYPYSTYFYESASTRKFQELNEYLRIIPSNFGYDTNRTIGDSLIYLPDENVYIITTEMMKLAPYAVSVDRRNRIKSFEDSDFIRLKSDPSVNLVYTNSEFGVWNIDIR